MKNLDDTYWEVLSWVYDYIRSQAFFTPGAKTLVYIEPEKLFPHKPIPLNYSVKSAVYTLQDEGAIEVLGEEDFGPKSGAPRKWEIKILQPRFKDFADELFDSGGIELGGILTWCAIVLNVKSGRAKVNDKPHSFNPKSPPFKIFKLMLEKRVYEIDDGEVKYNEFSSVSGIKDKETIKLKIREMRRQFGISRKKNPLEDIFQETGNGFRLIQPEDFK